ncbi:MAG: choice-of-anchor I family protein [Steroidobacteraceae bacterium]
MQRLRLALSISILCVPMAHAHGWFGEPDVSLSKLGTYSSGKFAEGAAEIVAYDHNTRRVFTVNASDVAVDVLDASNPRQLQKVGVIDASALGGSANSVAVYNGLLAVAIEATDRQANGVVAFYRTSDLSLINTVDVGALPDMVTFDSTGRYAVVANEGEPNDDYTIDPEGSVSVIDIRRGARLATVRHATFTALNGQEAALRAQGVRIYGPNASAAQDFEPEYITTSGRQAYVTLQENNAIAVVDLPSATVTKILPLGYKDHSMPGNGLDPSDRDNAIAIGNWPVHGIYSPDAIDSYQYRGKTFLVTANEGDTRDYDGYSEEARVSSLALDPIAFPDAAALKANSALGRLTVTKSLGDVDGDGDYDALYVPGGRSFSIWSSDGEQVFDSGSDIESITANLLPDNFNSNHDEQPSKDSRSDNKGPEPEGIAIGEYFGRTYAFVGLERMSGIMVYDITNPQDVSFVEYVSNRNFDVPVCLTDASGDCVAANPEAGDLGPEGLNFVPWYRSPTYRPLLVVGNEVSGTTTVYQLNLKFDRRK